VEFASGQDGAPSRRDAAPSPLLLFERNLRFGYAWGIAAVAASTAVSALGSRYLQLADLIMIQLVGVVAISTRFGVGPSLFTAVVSVFSFDYFFIPPAFEFAWPDVQSLITFGVMLAVAAVVSGLNVRLRRQEARARRSEARTAALYSMSRELAIVRTIDQLVGVASRHVERMFGAPAIILLAGPDGQLQASSLHGLLRLDERRAELGRQAWERREIVGLDSEQDEGVYLPLVGSHEPVGVLGVLSVARAHLREASQRELLETCSHQAATAIERALRAKDVHRAQLEVETERLRSSLLSAVSHDLKTPLTAILTAATTLAKSKPELDADRSALLASVAEEAQRLNALVANLLAMTRLESGTVEVQKMEEPIEEVVSSALGRLAGRLHGREVLTDVASDVPLAPMDPILIEQVLTNLLENALKYSPPASPIEIRIRREGSTVKVALLDLGPGVSDDEQDKVFEKFYRGARVARGDGGVGLGLTICRAIVHAHGGRIWIQNRRGGGAIVQFTLPCSVVSSAELGEMLERSLPEASERPKSA
jgi:two-component system sensor histidine kinase KdpD